MGADDVMDAYPEPENDRKARVWTWQCSDCSAWTINEGRGRHECGHCGVIKPFGPALLMYQYKYQLPTRVHGEGHGITREQFAVIARFVQDERKEMLSKQHLPVWSPTVGLALAALDHLEGRIYQLVSPRHG